MFKVYQKIKTLISITISGEFYHEIAAQILLVSLRQARRNEHFCILSRSDQDCILRHVWNELFLLHAAYWPIDVSALIRRALNNGHIYQNGTKAANTSIITNSTSRLLRRSLELCQNLQLDAVELSLLETLILCRKGKNKQNLAIRTIYNEIKCSGITKLKQYSQVGKMYRVKCNAVSGSIQTKYPTTVYKGKCTPQTRTCIPTFRK
jgi:hypothetical protein